MFQKPKELLIYTDDYHLEYFGEMADGNIAWIDYQLSSDGRRTIDYMCRFIFDSNGILKSHTITTLGVRGEYDRQDARKEFSKLLQSVGRLKPARKVIKTFSIDYDGKKFGLIPREPDEESDPWYVIFMPGNTLAFFPPFDSGAYDT